MWPPRRRDLRRPSIELSKNEVHNMADKTNEKLMIDIHDMRALRRLARERRKAAAAIKFGRWRESRSGPPDAGKKF
ncbi:hypothetical protein IEQ34_010339 [Dendrobium chrysotoxum]|uniref:Uncharacterized protein n=1 Tax=Dendrobium chrysotoxum TaxID=161865 RepID=A0AAV7GLW4_DENCH|nr:hypothetical protein IEQ34_010339 [Dendrobium chrysotoxum]